MLSRLRSLFRGPQPAGPPETVRAFGPADTPITHDGVAEDEGGWRVSFSESRSAALFEVTEPGVEQCLLTYRAQLKTEDAQGRVYLEMWCRLPGRGEFFSKGVHQAAKGTTEWASYETPFFLKAGQRPDLVKLNLASEGPATVWVKNVELLKTPLE